MKRVFSFITLLLLLGLASSEAQQENRGHGRRQGDQQRSYGDTPYATADDGTLLKWKVILAAGPGPHPAVLVIHGGHFAATPGSPNMLRAARDAAAAGLNAFLPDYRLAAEGRLPGQKSLGQYPDQTNDLKKAVRAARAYPGGNGKVGAIGGSSGASHAIYLAATGTKGDDRVDAAVGLSGAYDLVELESARRIIQRKIEGYVGSSSPEAARKASPVTYIDATVSPLFLIASDDETMPPGQLPALVKKLKEVGATNFKELLRTNSQRHAFSNWPDVRDEALEFLKEHLGAGAGLPKASPTAR
jgi:acetyl esterase/lipase